MGNAGVISSTVVRMEFRVLGLSGKACGGFGVQKIPER